MPKLRPDLDTPELIAYEDDSGLVQFIPREAAGVGLTGPEIPPDLPAPLVPPMPSQLPTTPSVSPIGIGTIIPGVQTVPTTPAQPPQAPSESFTLEQIAASMGRTVQDLINDPEIIDPRVEALRKKPADTLTVTPADTPIVAPTISAVPAEIPSSEQSEIQSQLQAVEQQATESLQRSAAIADQKKNAARLTAEAEFTSAKELKSGFLDIAKAMHDMGAKANELAGIRTEYALSRYKNLKSRREQLSRQQVDPKRFWKNKSLPGKISLVIAAGLAGFDAPFREGRNPILEMLMREAEKDIEVQIEDRRVALEALDREGADIGAEQEVLKQSHMLKLEAMTTAIEAMKTELKSKAAELDPRFAAGALDKMLGDLNAEQLARDEQLLQRYQDDWEDTFGLLLEAERTAAAERAAAARSSGRIGGGFTNVSPNDVVWQGAVIARVPKLSSGERKSFTEKWSATQAAAREMQKIIDIFNTEGRRFLHKGASLAEFVETPGGAAFRSAVNAYVLAKTRAISGAQSSEGERERIADLLKFEIWSNPENVDRRLEEELERLANDSMDILDIVGKATDAKGNFVGQSVRDQILGFARKKPAGLSQEEEAEVGRTEGPSRIPGIAEEHAELRTAQTPEDFIAGLKSITLRASQPGTDIAPLIPQLADTVLKAKERFGGSLIRPELEAEIDNAFKKLLKAANPEERKRAEKAQKEKQEKRFRKSLETGSGLR